MSKTDAKRLIKEIGDQIRLVRQSKRLNQENVAADLGLSLTAYSKIERGLTHMTIVRLVQIANYFNVDMMYLVAGNAGSTGGRNDELVLPDTRGATVLLLQNRVQALQEQIEQLHKMIVDKDIIIGLLNEKVNSRQ
jgi:transcriptional regulator with XRE-family HTH domain